MEMKIETKPTKLRKIQTFWIGLNIWFLTSSWKYLRWFGSPKLFCPFSCLIVFFNLPSSEAASENTIEMWVEILCGLIIYRLVRCFFYDDDLLDLETSDSKALFSVADRYGTSSLLSSLPSFCFRFTIQLISNSDLFVWLLKKIFFCYFSLCFCDVRIRIFWLLNRIECSERILKKKILFLGKLE